MLYEIQGESHLIISYVYVYTKLTRGVYKSSGNDWALLRRVYCCIDMHISSGSDE